MKLPPSAESETSPADNASSQQDVDFSDYMWMGEEMEEFDSKVIIVLVYPSRFSFEYYTMWQESETSRVHLWNFLCILVPDMMCMDGALHGDVHELNYYASVSLEAALCITAIHPFCANR